MVKRTLNAVLEYSSSSENLSNSMSRWEGTLFVDENGIFQGIINPTLDASDEQYIVGKFVGDQGIVFLRLSNEQTLSNDDVYAVLNKEVKEKTNKLFYEEIEPTPMSNYKPSEPLLRITALVSSSTLTKNERRKVRRRMEKWKSEAGKKMDNLIYIDEYIKSISYTVDDFEMELAIIEEWNEASPEFQGMISCVANECAASEKRKKKSNKAVSA